MPQLLLWTYHLQITNLFATRLFVLSFSLSLSLPGRGRGHGPGPGITGAAGRVALALAQVAESGRLAQEELGWVIGRGVGRPWHGGGVAVLARVGRAGMRESFFEGADLFFP